MGKYIVQSAGAQRHELIPHQCIGGLTPKGSGARRLFVSQFASLGLVAFQLGYLVFRITDRAIPSHK